MKLKESISLKRLGKETILYGEESHKVDYTEVISLNESAAMLVERSIGKTFELSDWTNLLVECYGIDEDVARNDAIKIIDKMRAAGLIE